MQFVWELLYIDRYDPTLSDEPHRNNGVCAGQGLCDRETGACVEGFDHYCPWVGNAVGRRNYRAFITFVAAANAQALLVMVTSFASLSAEMEVAEQRSMARNMARNAAWNGDGAADGETEEEQPVLNADAALRSGIGLGLGMYGLIILLSVGGLLMYHLNLICSATTTNESIKRRWNRQNPNPHDLGSCSNLAAFMSRPQPPSRIATAAVGSAVVGVSGGTGGAAAAPARGVELPAVRVAL